MDNRGVTPVVEKLLMIGIVVLFIGAVTAVLFGSAVPGYRDAAGMELGERVLASGAEQIESSIPPNGSIAAGETTVDVPETIRGEAYELRIVGRELVLDHPRPAVGGRIRLSLPAHVESLSGTLQSRGARSVRIDDVSTGVVIELGGS